MAQSFINICRRHRRDGSDRPSMRRQSGGEAFFGGVFVKVKELRGALEQIRGQVASLIGPPSGRVDKAHLASGTDHFQSAEPVQDRLDFAKVTFRQHQQEIVAGQARGEIGATTRLLQTPSELFQSLVGCRLTIALVDLGEFVQMNGGQAQRRILSPRAGNLFSKLLLDEGSRVQARDRIDAGRIGNFTRLRVRDGVLAAQLLSLPAERPLTVEHPAIEKKEQAQNSPTSLIGTDFVKMLAVPEKRGERGEQKGHRRERGDEKCGEPQPPLAPRDLPQAGFRLLCAESTGSLKRRGNVFAGAETEYRFHVSYGRTYALLH